MNSILRSLLGAVRETVCKMSGSVLLFSGKERELLLTILQTHPSKMKASNYLYKVMEKKNQFQQSLLKAMCYFADIG